MIEMLRRFPFAARFGERGLHGLEKSDVVANLDGIFASGTEREGLRRLRYDLEPLIGATRSAVG